MVHLRWDLEWTQRDLARHSKVALRTIVSVETGQRSPRRSTRRKLLRALGVPAEKHRDIFGALPDELRIQRRTGGEG